MSLVYEPKSRVWRDEIMEAARNVFKVNTCKMHSATFIMQSTVKLDTVDIPPLRAAA